MKKYMMAFGALILSQFSVGTAAAHEAQVLLYCDEYRGSSRSQYWTVSISGGLNQSGLNFSWQAVPGTVALPAVNLDGIPGSSLRPVHLPAGSRTCVPYSVMTSDEVAQRLGEGLGQISQAVSDSMEDVKRTLREELKREIKAEIMNDLRSRGVIR